MMNKTILMLSASCMSLIAGADLCYADFNHFDTSPSFIPAGVKSHVSTHTSHLTAEHLSSLEDFDKDDNKNIQLAAACFVTDTSGCSGNEFGGNNADDDGHGAPGGPGGDDYGLDNAERCRQEGYTQTSCPEGQEPSNFCPYDSNYFETVSKAWAKPAAENMPPVATAAKVLIMSPFPTAISRTAHFVPAVTVSNTKSNATPASILNAPPAAPAPVPTITALITKNATVRPIMNGTMFPSPASAPRFINTTASANTLPAATVKAATINMPVANAKPAMSGMTHKVNA